MNRILTVTLLFALSVACAPHKTAKVPPGGENPAAGASAAVVSDSLTDLARILDSDSLIGALVTVSGHCLGWDARMAQGPPPLTRSDWQLESNGRGIYVSGAMPEGCLGQKGSPSLITIRAQVQQDTIPFGSGRVPTARRFLVRVP